MRPMSYATRDLSGNCAHLGSNRFRTRVSPIRMGRRKVNSGTRTRHGETSAAAAVEVEGKAEAAAAEAEAEGELALAAAEARAAAVTAALVWKWCRTRASCPLRRSLATCTARLVFSLSRHGPTRRASPVSSARDLT